MTEELKPIAEEELVAFRRATKQRVAAALLEAHASAGMSVEEVAARLGATPAQVQAYLMKLIMGKPIGGFDTMCDIAYALGCTIRFNLYHEDEGWGPVQERLDRAEADAERALVAMEASKDAVP